MAVAISLHHIGAFRVRNVFDQVARVGGYSFGVGQASYVTPTLFGERKRRWESERVWEVMRGSSRWMRQQVGKESMALQRRMMKYGFAVVSLRVVLRSVYVYHLPGQMGVFVDIQSYLFYYPCSKSDFYCTINNPR